MNGGLKLFVHYLPQELQQQAQQQALIAQATANKVRMPRARALNKPRGRMTAYAFFVQTCREEHKRKHPDENVIFAAFSKKCAERWNVSLLSYDCGIKNIKNRDRDSSSTPLFFLRVNCPVTLWCAIIKYLIITIIQLALTGI